jgi:hypothetical protein
MAIAGLIVTILIAVGTWAVTQTQARRAARRTMRVNYLLDAYRRLDRASNCPLVPATAQDIEAAISDIILLGSPTQARLADEFVRTFAAENVAEAIPLLQDLRASLRRELLLEELPQSSYITLRMNFDNEPVSGSARIWRETIQATRHALSTELANQGLPADFATFPNEMAQLANTASPSAAIAESTQRLEHALRQLLTGASTEDLTALNRPQLTNRVLQLKLIDPQLADSLDGLSVMRHLAATDQDRLTHDRATEYADLSAALLYLLNHARAPATPDANNRQTPSPPPDHGRNRVTARLRRQE